LEFLGAFVGAVALAHGDGPDAARDAAEDGVLEVHAVGEEEGQIGGKIVDIHASGEVVFDEGEAVGEGERELADGVRSGLGDVVAADGYRVIVANLPLDE